MITSREYNSAGNVVRVLALRRNPHYSSELTGSARGSGLSLARAKPSELVHARFTERERERLAEHALFAETSISGLIRSVMTQYMDGVEYLPTWRETHGDND